MIRELHIAVFLPIWIWATMAEAQSLNVDSGMGGAGLRVVPGSSTGASAPSPRAVNVLPASVPIEIHATPFLLHLGEDRRYGPFPFENGTRLLLGNTPFDLLVTGERIFSLKRIADGMTSGPFSFTDGGSVLVNSAELRIRKVPAYIVGRCDLKGVSASRVPVALVAMNDETPSRLLTLLTTFEGLKAEVAYLTAPRRLNAPTISGPPGMNYSPVIARSQADISRASSSADLRARKAVETFLSQSKAQTTLVAMPAGSFAFHGLPAGRYLVCLLADIRDSESNRTLRFKPLIWWADITLGDFEWGGVVFSLRDGRSWQELFQ